MLRNLVHNALNYSPPGSAVGMALAAKDNGFAIEVRNLVGRAGTPDAEQLFGKYYRADTAKHLTGTSLGLLAPSGKTVELTQTETEVLTQLALVPERQLDAEFLLRKLSQEYALSKHRDALTVLISRLRHKLALHLGEEEFVKAIRGFGYKLNAPISIEN